MNELRTLLPFFRPYRRGVALGIALVIVANIFSTGAPYLVKLAVEEMESPDPTYARITLFAGLIVLAAVLGGAAKYGMRELLNGISRRIEVDLRNRFFRHLLRLDASFYSEKRTGDLMAHSTNDLLAARMAAGPAIMYAVNTTVSFSFALALMLWISPKLTVLALIPLLGLPPVVLGFSRIIHERYEMIQEQFSKLSTMVQENLTGIRIVRAYTQEAAQAGRFDRMNQRYLDRNMELVRMSGLFRPLLGVFSGAAMVIVLWVGGLEVMAGRISIGDFVAFTIYLGLLVWPMIALGWVVNLFQRGAASMGRINRILEREPEIVAPPDPVPINGGGQVEFRSVAFRYPGTDRLVLRNVSFVAEPGQTVALVGPTGAGKSTLISLLPRIYDPTEGTVLLDGVPLTDHDPDELREVMGVVPQDAFLFSTSIAENIAFGLDDGSSTSATDRSRCRVAPDGPRVEGPPAPSQIVRRSSETARLHDTIAEFPRQYATHLGERGLHPAGAERNLHGDLLGRRLRRRIFDRCRGDRRQCEDRRDQGRRRGSAAHADRR